MSDRELLEAAAKAAGMDAAEAMWHPRAGFVWVKRVDGIRTENAWNPLTDDGDALRLAVSVEAEVKFDREREVYVAAGDGWEYPETYAENNGDRHAATRRAIVRAAAAIGRSGEREGETK